MNVVILGAGSIGIKIAKQLSIMEYNISIVDKSPQRIKYISDKIDVKHVVGHACDINTLKEAGIEKADIVIAMTPYDSVNILACQIASQSFKTETKIAKINNSLYCRNGTTTSGYIDFVVSFDQEILEIVKHGMYIRNALSVFKVKNALIITTVCKNNAPILSGLYTQDIQVYDLISIIDIKRNKIHQEKTSINDIQPGDEITFCVDTTNKQEAMKLFGYDDNNKNTVIIGGGYISKAINSINIENTINIKIIEDDLNTANILSEKTNIDIIHGNPMNFDVLDESCVKDSVVVAMTKDDKANILSGLYAKKAGASYVSVLLHDIGHVRLTDKLDFSSILDAKSSIVNKIIGYIHKQDKCNITSINERDLISIDIKRNSYFAGMKILDIESEYKIRVVTLIRSGAQISFSKNYITNNGDTIIVLVKKNKTKNIISLAASRPEYL